MPWQDFVKLASAPAVDSYNLLLLGHAFFLMPSCFCLLPPMQAAAGNGKPPASKRQRKPPVNSHTAPSNTEAPGAGGSSSSACPLLAVPLPTLATDLAAEAAGSGGGGEGAGGYQQTEYARNRPRREVVNQKLVLGHTSESLDLVKCCDYVGPPGSGAPLAQPFAVEVTSQVGVAGSRRRGRKCKGT